MPRSTAHRILLSLMRRGYVVSPERGRYVLGPAMRRLGDAASNNHLLAEVGRPVLARLARECRVHAHLGVLDGEMVTYLVCRAFGPHPIAAVEGGQLEPYCSAVGKVLLAHEQDDRLAAYLHRDDFVRLTPGTITAASDLKTEFAKVRSQDWAMDDEEIVPDLRCLAVPIRDADGVVRAALSVSASVGRMPPSRFEPMRSRLRDVADTIERLVFHIPLVERQ